MELDWRPLIRALAADVAAGTGPAVMSRRFHSGIVAMVVAECEAVRRTRMVNQVVLSGGVFLNEFLLVNCLVALRRAGFEAHCHKLVPTNEETEVPASQRTEFGPVLGCSATMRELYVKLEAVAASECSLLIEGETGVGKELVAESVHQASARRDGPFVVVDCGSLAEDLVESELFGHVKGAFTGAHEERRGMLEAASSGTVFFDEIGELPPQLQVKLLGALERRHVRPIGAKDNRPIDVRVMAATNRDLAREVNAGRFRSDLFYRLAVVRLRVAPLRERLEDLPMLVRAFLSDLKDRYGGSVPEELSALALARMSGQAWPG